MCVWERLCQHHTASIKAPNWPSTLQFSHSHWVHLCASDFSCFCPYKYTFTLIDLCTHACLVARRASMPTHVQSEHKHSATIQVHRNKPAAFLCSLLVLRERKTRQNRGCCRVRKHRTICPLRRENTHTYLLHVQNKEFPLVLTMLSFKFILKTIKLLKRQLQQLVTLSSLTYCTD